MVQITANDSRAFFNDGNASKLHVLEELGLKPVYFCIQAFKALDVARIKKWMLFSKLLLKENKGVKCQKSESKRKERIQTMALGNFKQFQQL